MGAINHKPGYHRVYGETTKHASESSVFSRHSRMFDGTESLRSDPVWLDVPNWLARNTCQMMGHSLYPTIQNRQGKSMPPTDSWVGNRNMGTCPTCPPRKRASRGDRR
jgi:hypothetical protein